MPQRKSLEELTPEELERKEEGKKIQKIRKAFGYRTPKDFAPIVGTSKDSIESYESGRRPIPQWYHFRLRDMQRVERLNRKLMNFDSHLTPEELRELCRFVHGVGNHHFSQNDPRHELRMHLVEKGYLSVVHEGNLSLFKLFGNVMLTEYHLGCKIQIEEDAPDLWKVFIESPLTRELHDLPAFCPSSQLAFRYGRHAIETFEKSSSDVEGLENLTEQMRDAQT